MSIDVEFVIGRDGKVGVDLGVVGLIRVVLENLFVWLNVVGLVCFFGVNVGVYNDVCVYEVVVIVVIFFEVYCGICEDGSIFC